MVVYWLVHDIGPQRNERGTWGGEGDKTDEGTLVDATWNSRKRKQGDTGNGWECFETQAREHTGKTHEGKSIRWQYKRSEDWNTRTRVEVFGRNGTACKRKSSRDGTAYKRMHERQEDSQQQWRTRQGLHGGGAHLEQHTRKSTHEAWRTWVGVNGAQEGNYVGIQPGGGTFDRGTHEVNQRNAQGKGGVFYEKWWFSLLPSLLHFLLCGLKAPCGPLPESCVVNRKALLGVYV